MTDMPETIWATWGQTYGEIQMGQWADTIRSCNGGTEYALAAPLVARIEALEAENKRLRDLPRKIMARGGTIGEVCIALTPAEADETEVERILRTLAKDPTP